MHYEGRFWRLSVVNILSNITTLVVFVPTAALALLYRNNHLLWVSITAFTTARAATLAWQSRRLIEGYRAGNSGAVAVH